MMMAIKTTYFSVETADWFGNELPLMCQEDALETCFRV